MQHDIPSSFFNCNVVYASTKRVEGKFNLQGVFFRLYTAVSMDDRISGI